MEENLVAFEEISDEMTEAEYAGFLERLESKGYFNDVKKDADGSPIDGGVYILEGMRLLNEAVAGE